MEEKVVGSGCCGDIDGDSDVGIIVASVDEGGGWELLGKGGGCEEGWQKVSACSSPICVAVWGFLESSFAAPGQLTSQVQKRQPQSRHPRAKDRSHVGRRTMSEGRGLSSAQRDGGRKGQQGVEKKVEKKAENRRGALAC